MTSSHADPYDPPMTQQATPADTNETTVAAPDGARYQIGEVADRTGVTQRTLRFYEEKGLLQPSERMQGGFRLYSEADVERIESIKRLQGLLGLTLAEIKEMVDAEELLQQVRATFRPGRELRSRKRRVAKVLSALHLQLDIVERKMEQLHEMKKTLNERVETVQQRSREIDEALARGDGAGS